MIVLSDIRYCIIPDELICAGCVFATVGVFPDILSGTDWATRLSPVLGAAIGAGIIFLINCLGRLLYKKDALGMGDLKLMIVCGILCGTVGTVISMLIGIFAAGFWFAAAIALKRVRSEEYMPLGPFLVFGTIFTLCFRPMIDSFLAWYISLI
jgi:leader peptidase (prepilin peptidase)/N-methyltransferase